VQRRYLGIPSATQARISEYFEYLTLYKHPGPEAISLISQLPASMHHDITTFMFFEIVQKVGGRPGACRPVRVCVCARVRMCVCACI